MPSDIERVYDICDQTYDEFKERLSTLFNELGKRLIEKLRESDIPLTEVSGRNLRSDSKAKLMAEDRLLSLCQSSELDFRMSCLGEM